MNRQTGILLFILLVLSQSALAMEWKRLMIGDHLMVKVEIARTSVEQEIGLGGRDSVPEGTGMLFVYNVPGNRIFWMKGMSIPIDILWARNGQIVFIEHQVPPPSSLAGDRSLKRYGKGIRADMVLELPAGYAVNHTISPGQSIRLIP